MDRSLFWCPFALCCPDFAAKHFQPSTFKIRNDETSNNTPSRAGNISTGKSGSIFLYSPLSSQSRTQAPPLPLRCQYPRPSRCAVGPSSWSILPLQGIRLQPRLRGPVLQPSLLALSYFIRRLGPSHLITPSSLQIKECSTLVAFSSYPYSPRLHFFRFCRRHTTLFPLKAAESQLTPIQ